MCEWVVATDELSFGVEPGEVGEIIYKITDDLVVIDWDLYGEAVCDSHEYQPMEGFDERDQS